MISKIAVFIIPLVSYIAYNAAVKPAYLSMTCSLANLGCPSDIPIHGYVNDEYKDVYDIFLNNFKDGHDIGASVSAYVNGKQVLSLQGGWQDIHKKIEYTNKTLQMVFSSTKALSAIVIAQLVEKGVLDYDEKIATYWPEFAQGNKENVTLMDLMRHTAGIGALDYPLSYLEASNPERFSEILAKQPHNFDGKPLHCYQAITQGWYQNEILRRVEGRTVDDYVAEFKDKWGSEWYLKPDATEGVDLNRIAPFYPISVYQQVLPLFKAFMDPVKGRKFVMDLFDKDSLFSRSIKNPHFDQFKGIMNMNITHRALEGPSYSGHTNTDSMAKLAAMMANRGKAIVSGEPNIFDNDATFEETTRFIAAEPDLLITHLPIINARGGLMIFPNEVYFKLSENTTEFIGGVGAGGSVFVFNEKYKIGFAYMTNGYKGSGPDQRSIPLLRSIFEIVKKQKEL